MSFPPGTSPAELAALCNGITGCLGHELVGDLGRLEHHRACRLNIDIIVDRPVLQRLKAPDWAIELLAHLDVLDCHVEGGAGNALAFGSAGGFSSFFLPLFLGSGGGGGFGLSLSKVSPTRSFTFCFSSDFAAFFFSSDWM